MFPSITGWKPTSREPIRRRSPRKKERIENLSRDIDACQPILDQGKDHFQIVIAGKKLYRPQGGRAALIQACTSAGQTTQEVPIGEYGGFQLMGSFNLFSHKYELTVHGRGSYAFELGADPFGNLTRLNNIFSGSAGASWRDRRNSGLLP